MPVVSSALPVDRVQASEKGRRCDINMFRPCLVNAKNQKVFKISCHIESCSTCMKY